MRARVIAGTFVMAAIALDASGCGASCPATRHAATRAAAGRSSSAVTGALTRALLVTGTVLAARFASFHAIAPPTVARAAWVWVADGGLPGYESQLAADRLARVGFVAGVREDLFGDERSSAQLTAILEDFRSPAGARAQLE
jgi:hypothetical protein